VLTESVGYAYTLSARESRVSRAPSLRPVREGAQGAIFVSRVIAMSFVVDTRDDFGRFSFAARATALPVGPDLGETKKGCGTSLGYKRTCAGLISPCKLMSPRTKDEHGRVALIVFAHPLLSLAGQFELTESKNKCLTFPRLMTRLPV